MWAAIRQSEKRSDFAGLTPSIVLAVLATGALIFTLTRPISHEHHVCDSVLHSPDCRGLDGRSTQADLTEGQWHAKAGGQW